MIGHYKSVEGDVVTLDELGEPSDGGEGRLGGADSADDGHDAEGDLRADGEPDPVAHLARDGQDIAHGDDEILRDGIWNYE